MSLSLCQKSPGSKETPDARQPWDRVLEDEELGLEVSESEEALGGVSRQKSTWGRCGQAGPEARVRVEGNAANRED